MASRPSLSLSRKSPLKSKKATNSSGGGGSGGGSKKTTTAAAVATNARVSMRLNTRVCD